MRLYRKRWKSGSGSLSGISLAKGRLWDNWLVQKSWRSSPTCQAFIGLGFFCGLGFLYGLGSWFASSQNTSLSDIKTTQEGFLEVSKILGDPRTTTHPATFEGSPSTSVLLTKDLYSSKWSRQLPEKCSGKQKTLLITVISAPDHFEERQAIRKGWGKTALKMPKVAFIFMVGIQNDRLSELFDESDKYEDMVITDHLDTYNNLTLKTLAAFDWMLTQCPQAEYLLKTDDDMFIQVQRLLAVIRGLSKSVPSQKLIVGNVASGWVPVRNPKSKYFITEDQYAEASYPAFVTGPSYLVSKLAVKILYYSALEHPFLHLEDVFLTGIIAEKEDIPRRHAVEFRNNPVRIPAKFLGCTLLRTISIHKVLPKEQKELAEMATNPQCGKGLHKLH